MSKTVILFTTYFITPDYFGNKGLFCRESIKESFLSASSILNFFWERLQKDTNYINKYLPACLNNSEEISFDPRLNDSLIQSCLQKCGLNPKDEPDWAEKLNEYIWSEESPFYGDEVTNISDILNRGIEVSLSGKSAQWLLENLNSSIDQGLFYIYTNSKDLKNAWLRARFSFYSLKSVNKAETSIYAMWPLSQASNQDEWIGALTDQILETDPDVETIFLILHNKDIGDSSFKVIESEKVLLLNERERKRTVAVFAHSGDDIGRLLQRNDATANDVYRIVTDKCLGRDSLLLIVNNLTHGEFNVAKMNIEKLKIIKPSFCEVLSPMIESIQTTEDKREKATNVYKMICQVNSMLREFDL